MDMTAFDKLDTKTNTLPNGEPRCERCTKYWDEQTEDNEWARCPSPATLRVRSTCPEGRVKEANSCRACYEDFLRHAGELGYPAKVEALESCLNARETFKALAGIAEGPGPASCS